MKTFEKVKTPDDVKRKLRAAYFAQALHKRICERQAAIQNEVNMLHSQFKTVKICLCTAESDKIKINDTHD